MQQFALQIEINLSKDETLANGLNALLLSNVTWKVVTWQQTIVMKDGGLMGKNVPMLIATVVFESPEADMPEMKMMNDTTDVPIKYNK